MEIRVFTIPIHDRPSVDELNGFLASHRVISIDREFIADGQDSAWSICVTVQNGEPARASGKQKDRIDYREVLSESEFRLYAKLRTLRKELSESDGVPAYTLFTNEQLMARCGRDRHVSSKLTIPSHAQSLRPASANESCTTLSCGMWDQCSNAPSLLTHSPA